MSLTSSDALTSAPVPLWIPTPGGQVFCWYHPPAGRECRRPAVLLCDPFGMDRMVLHLTYRQLALRLAREGFAVLRVDYPGTCDSEGMPRQCARVETWLESLDAAADRLKVWSGAKELVACGVLLGGTLAMLLAKRRSDISTLVMWGTYVKGRSAVRAAVAATVTLSSNPEGREPASAKANDQEALGFLLTQAMSTDLQAVDLLGNEAISSVRRALILLRTAESTGKKLAQHLTEQGITVDVRETPGESLDGLLQMGGAGNPILTINSIAQWLVGDFQEFRQTSALDRSTLCPSEILLHESEGARVRESARYVGANEGVFSIFSEPVERKAHALGIVLVNAGGNHRPGINRNYTEWARALSGRGYRVLRIDLPGLGDSPPAEPGELSLLYRAGARHDVVDAANWLRKKGASSVACIGLCAGGYHAFQAAQVDETISSIVMLNPLRFNEERLEDYKVLRHSSDRWRHTMSLPLDLLPLARRCVSFSRKLFRHCLPWLSKAGRTPGDIRKSLAGLVDRGTSICILYNDNEPTLAYLEHALRPIRARLESTGRFRLETVGHADHIYSPLWIQERVSNVVLRHVQALASRAEAPLKLDSEETGPSAVLDAR